MIDHKQRRSAITIVGSFASSTPRSSVAVSASDRGFDQHYVFSALEDDQLGSATVETFPSAEEVEISSFRNPFTLTWKARNIGTLSFTDTHSEVDFDFSATYGTNSDIDHQKETSSRLRLDRLKINTNKRIPWDGLPIKKECTGSCFLSRVFQCFRQRRWSFSGPEGWTGLFTSLLPCHYFIHSVGSDAKYEIDLSCTSTVPVSAPVVTNRDSAEEPTFWDLYPPSDYKDNLVAQSTEDSFETSTLQRTEVVPLDQIPHPVAQRVQYHLAGEGSAHIEGNHGSFFPQGWIWSQGIDETNNASFSLVSGQFIIRPISPPMTTVLHLRHRNNNRVTVLRTVDLFDRIHYRHTHKNITSAIGGQVLGETVVEGKSILKNCRIRLHIRAIQPMNEPNRTVFHQLHIPTREGFSNTPGCKETYLAHAKVEYWNSYWKNHQTVAADEVYEFPLTAYEFGGVFIGNRIGL